MSNYEDLKEKIEKKYSTTWYMITNCTYTKHPHLKKARKEALFSLYYYYNYSIKEASEIIKIKPNRGRRIIIQYILSRREEFKQFLKTDPHTPT